MAESRSPAESCGQPETLAPFIVISQFGPRAGAMSARGYGGSGGRIASTKLAGAAGEPILAHREMILSCISIVAAAAKFAFTNDKLGALAGTLLTLALYSETTRRFVL
jgi:hypothetical protein